MKPKMCGCLAIIIVFFVVGSAAFVYFGGLTMIGMGADNDAVYRVSYNDPYGDALVGSTIEVKIFGSHLSAGYEVVDVSSGFGYIMADFGDSVHIIMIVDGKEEDTFYGTPLGEWVTVEAGGFLVDIMVERLKAA